MNCASMRFLMNNPHLTDTLFCTLHASKLISLSHLCLDVPSWTSTDRNSFGNTLENATRFLSDGLPSSLKTLDFIFNRDRRMNFPIDTKLKLKRLGEHNVHAIECFTLLFKTKISTHPVTTTFRLLNLRRNRVTLCVDALKNMFKFEESSNSPRIIAFAIGEEGGFYRHGVVTCVIDLI